MSLIYLAQPYSHPDPAVRQERYEQGCKAAAILMGQGLHIYSPIAHGHGIALAGELPTDWAFWEAHCCAILSACEMFWVLTLPGWGLSKGIEAEKQIAQKLGIPIKFIHPSDLWK